MYVTGSLQWNNMMAFAHALASSKKRLLKKRLLWIRCVSLLDISFDNFSSEELYQLQILCFHVVMKKLYNFLEKSELPKFMPAVKICWLIFLRFPGWKWKKLQRSEQAHFPVSRRLRRSVPCTLVHQFSPTLQREPAVQKSTKCFSCGTKSFI